MDLFEVFYAQEWVQVATAFSYVFLIIAIPFMFLRISTMLTGERRKNYIELSLEIYFSMLLLLLAPVGYLVLYFLGSENRFMLNDPLPWVCLLGGASAIIDLFRSRLKLNHAKALSDCSERLAHIYALKRIINMVVVLAFIPFVYGLVMVGVTNLVDTATLSSLVWFITFLITGLAIIYTAGAKALFFVSQAFAANSDIGVNKQKKMV